MHTCADTFLRWTTLSLAYILKYGMLGMENYKNVSEGSVMRLHAHTHQHTPTGLRKGHLLKGERELECK